jgi:hypothetical protein
VFVPSYYCREADSPNVLGRALYEHHDCEELSEVRDTTHTGIDERARRRSLEW